MNIKVYHNNKEINWRVPKDSFPDITTAYKGDGYFDFEVEPLSFKINKKGLNLNIDDIIVIKDDKGKVLLNGFIDELGDELSNPIEVTVYPQSLKLKDINAGSEVMINEDPDNEEKAIDYKTDGFQSVRDIFKDLAKQASEETGWNFTCTDATIPEPASTSDRYFGNKLAEIKFGQLKLLKDSMHFRKRSEILYLVTIDSGLVMRPILQKGQLGTIKLQVPKEDRNIIVTTVEQGAWLNFELTIPPEEIAVPGIGAYYNIYRCDHGGITHLENIVWDARNPLSAVKTKIEAQYGPEIELKQYGNFSNKQGVEAILSEMGYNLKEIYSIIDVDANNTYALIKAHEKSNDIFGRDMLISLETSVDFYYKLHYRNKSIMDVMKDMAIVMDRYLYIDPNNKIYLYPRSDNPGSVKISRNKVLNLQKNTSNQDEISVSVNRYTENDKGEPKTYGIQLRDNEWTNIENSLKEKFTGKKTEYIWKVLNPPKDIELAKEVIMDKVSYGLIIRMCRNRLENTVEFTTEVYHV